MGQEIVYCFKCATRLVSSDFEKGRAVRKGNRVSCSTCLPDLPEALPAEDRGNVPAGGAASVSSRGLRPPSTTRVRAMHGPTAAESHMGPLFLLAAAVVIVMIALIALMAGGGRTTEAPRTSQPPPEKAPAPPPPSPPPAQRALEAPSPSPRDFAKEVAALDDQARPLRSAESFKSAADLYEAARGRRDLPEWKSLLEARAEGVRKEAARLLDSLKGQAAAARTAGREDQVKALRDRVTGWGLPDLADALEAHLANVPEPKRPSPALPAYRALWSKAAARAASRDFDAASEDLGRAAKEAADEDVRREASADAELFRRMAAAVADAQGALAVAASGRAMTLTIRAADGTAASVSGPVVRADRNRLELAGAEGKPVFVEMVDVAARTLSEHSPSGRDVLVLLAALEGDATATLPEKYVEYAKGARENLPRRPPREDEARRLFYAAEVEFRSTETLASAVEKYRSLLRDFEDTRVVAGDAALVKRRSEAGREYTFAADTLKGAGTFRLSPLPKVELAWTSVGASDAASSVGNYVEIQFAALADTPYRAWAYAGACCLETFAFYLQATDLTVTNPRKTSEKLPAGPGEAHAMTVKPSFPGLRALHASHGGPREPRRWEWVALPLPKFASSGLKKVRFLTDSAGFSVAVVTVSALRTAPPGEAELKAEADRLRGSAAAAVAEGLVGWWRFDEGSGTTVVDATGTQAAGKIVGSPVWEKGRFGGGLLFNGKDTEVSVPSAPALKITEDLTIAFWIRKTGEPEGWTRYVGKGSEARRNYGVWDGAGTDTRILFQQWNDSKEKVVDFYSKTGLEVGPWYHLACVVRGNDAEIYINGVLDSTGRRSGSPATSDDPLTIGHGLGSDHTYASALLDEVRIYNRGLREVEIRALMKGAAEPAGRPSADLRPWRPLFDGKTLDFLNSQDKNDWRVENGAVTHVAGRTGAAQSVEVFGDAEFRVRFEAKDCNLFRFTVRQGAEGSISMTLDGAAVAALGGGVHEILLACRGESVTATIDGRPATLETIGKPLPRGHLQFNAPDGTVRILSIDTREVR